MAPGPGRNVQLPASVLQPTTSIYRTAALRPALSAHPKGALRAPREAHTQRGGNTSPRDADQLLAGVQRQLEEKGKKRRSYSMGGTGGGGGGDDGGGGGGGAAPAFSFFP